MRCPCCDGQDAAQPAVKSTWPLVLGVLAACPAHVRHVAHTPTHVHVHVPLHICMDMQGYCRQAGVAHIYSTERCSPKPQLGCSCRSVAVCDGPNPEGSVLGLQIATCSQLTLAKSQASYGYRSRGDEAHRCTACQQAIMLSPVPLVITGTGGDCEHRAKHRPLNRPLLVLSFLKHSTFFQRLALSATRPF